MRGINPSKHELIRLRVFGLFIVLAFGVLILFLWRMQIGHGVDYQSSFEKQSIRRIRLPGRRGKIFDCRGVCLADNNPNYCIAIYLEELRRIKEGGKLSTKAWKLIQQISGVIGKKPVITKSEIANHLTSRTPLPILAWQNVSQETLAKFAEASPHLPAAEIAIKPQRLYPWHTTACHLLGYVSTSQPQGEESDCYHYYLPDMSGKRGIEKRFDKELAGKPGGALVRIDVSGFKYGEISRRPPIPGKDILLSIDLRIQELAEKALSGGVGAITILDPHNGDILAMASSPGFDLADFSPSISRKSWSQLLQDKRKPLLNRAVNGLYPPGSIFKPVVAIAGLESKEVTKDTVFKCAGYINVGHHRFTCYNRTGHGWLGFQKAIEVSCNVFFYKLGLRTGYDCIYQTARAIGIGRKTGIELDYEASGLLPSRKWVLQKYGRSWLAGDTCNISIGQGPLLVTPLQMAVVAAAIANDGYVYQPRLVLGIRCYGETEFQRTSPIVVKRMELSQETLNVVKAGMREVIHGSEGTGRLAAVDGITMAGKTGTAEYGRKAQKKHHGWMILFAPFHNPQYAVAIVLEDAVSGGQSVAPRLSWLMSKIFALPGKNIS